MTGNAVELVDVSKRYFLGEHLGGGTSLRDFLWSYLAHRGRSPVEEIWSLRNLSLEIPAGAALGVLGRNGAGKSTLLKVITRITQPTSGVSRTRGRIGSLLEVGTGFHPELTGRENIFLNGAVLGMSRRDVQNRFDEIVEFSGIPKFIDTPVKRYSSGMYMRLAFAVAAHLEADILAVDEVLAVGDAEFQKRCLGKMSEIEGSGKTLLFVSHNLDALRRLCSHCIWLERGQVREAGPAPAVIDAYLGSGLRHRGIARFPDSQGPVRLREVGLYGTGGTQGDVLPRDEAFQVEVVYDVADPVTGLDLAVIVQDVQGRTILNEALSDSEQPAVAPPGRYRNRVSVPPLLGVGEYSVSIWVGTQYEDYAWEADALQFRLEGDARNRRDRLLHLETKWQLTLDPGDVPMVEDV